jgi:hypothetical protein
MKIYSKLINLIKLMEYNNKNIKDKEISKVKDKEMVLVNMLMVISIKVAGKVINNKDMVY